MTNFKSQIEKQINDANEFITNKISDTEKIIEDLQQNYNLSKSTLTRIQNILSETEDRLKQVESLSEFQVTLLKSQNGDRKAYNRLGSLLKDENFPYQELAYSAFISIREEYVWKNKMPYVTPRALFKDNIDPNTLSIDAFVREYFDFIGTEQRPGWVKYIWKREDFQKSDRIDFLISVLQDDNNLDAVNLAGRFLSEETKIKWNPFQIEPFVEWWGKNKENYGKD